VLELKILQTSTLIYREIFFRQVHSAIKNLTSFFCFLAKIFGQEKIMDFGAVVKKTTFEPVVTGSNPGSRIDFFF
jgi:hypothetical protein